MEKTIYLAGGCFWGLEKYFRSCIGIVDCEVGYVNGNQQTTTYEKIKESDHVEAVKLTYDDTVISLRFILELFYEVIDPTSLNQQGNDVGRQYRTGIYYVNKEDENTIIQSIRTLQDSYNALVVVEVQALKNYCKAELYHQKYLEKNPNGYCHINYSAYTKISKIKEDPYLKKGIANGL